jgi:hypothetical protein
MFSFQFKTISILSIVLFSYFTFHSFEHYSEHFSANQDETECTYFDLIKFTPTNYKYNEPTFFGIETKKYFHKNNNYSCVSRLYDPRGPPII